MSEETENFWSGVAFQMDDSTGIGAIEEGTVSIALTQGRFPNCENCGLEVGGAN